MKTIMKITTALFLLLLCASCNEKKTDVVDDNEEMTETKMQERNDTRFEAWNTGDHDLMLTTMDEDFKRFSNGRLQFEGKEGYRAVMQGYMTAFPDLNFEYELLGTASNKTFTKWIAYGTNTGSFNGQPATDKQLSIEGFTVITYNDEGLATMEESFLNELDLFSNLGYSISPPGAENN